MSDQPLWAAVMLTLADVLERPELTVAVWGGLGLQAALWTAWRRSPGPARRHGGRSEDRNAAPAVRSTGGARRRN